jgi:hypothetical protein
MERMLFRAWLWSTPLLLLTAAGCGSTGPGETFDGGTDAGNSEDAKTSDARLTGRDGEGGITLHSGDDGGSGDSAACATDHAKSTPAPAFLVFIMDHSDSMKADSKWTSCSAALESFFSSTTTTNLSASLSWFPFVPSTGKNPKASCTVSDYETPAVAMTTLPASSFGTVIAAEELQAGTPTLPALQGGVAYAETIQKANPKGKVLIVLATDGLPVGCTGNTVAAVASEAATALSSDGIPTYVIGVGDKLTNLDMIAAGGGTKTAFIVSTTDPATTTAEFEAAIQNIQGTLGCDYPIPAPPGGGTIDYTKVNVELTDSSGKKTGLAYSADCSSPDGWDYDDPKNPTKIVLCSGACAEAEGAVGGSMDIVFGCKNGFVP